MITPNSNLSYLDQSTAYLTEQITNHAAAYRKSQWKLMTHVRTIEIQRIAMLNIRAIQAELTKRKSR